MAIHMFALCAGNAVCGLGLILNVVVLNVLFDQSGINRYAANLVAVLIVSIWNYTLNVRLGWRTAIVSADSRA
jgi:dolichol-phosphate mannosyltransferase